MAENVLSIVKWTNLTKMLQCLQMMCAEKKAVSVTTVVITTIITNVRIVIN